MSGPREETNQGMTFLKKGMTFVEVTIALVLLLSGVTALLLSMQTSAKQAEYLSQWQVAIYAAQGRLEALTASPFETLWGPSFAAAHGSGQFEAIAGLLNGGLAIQIRSADGQVPPDLLQLHVAPCWTFRGRAVGEDRNCNGQLDAGEDLNGDTWITSPAMVSTRVARRD